MPAASTGCSKMRGVLPPSTINNLSVVNGVATGPVSPGGGIYVGAGRRLVLDASTVAGNSTAAETGGT